MADITGEVYHKYWPTLAKNDIQNTILQRLAKAGIDQVDVEMLVNAKPERLTIAVRNVRISLAVTNEDIRAAARLKWAGIVEIRD